MFPITLETEPSEIDLPVEEHVQQEIPAVDEVALSINEDIFECFQLFDTNRTGAFDFKHLNKALKCLGISLTSVELDDIKATLFKDGTVPYEPFRTFAFDKMKEADPFEALRAAFHVFDPENEGLLPSDRFKRWMATLGNPLPDKEIKELVKMGDPGNKGFIIYEDLIGLLLS